MQRQMIYYSDERAREMELAAAERQMGCSCPPLGRMISRVIRRCNGREGRVRGDERLNYAMAYPAAQTCYVRPAAQTVTYATSNHHLAAAHSHAIPSPEPPRTYGTPPGAAAPPGGKPRKKKKKRVRFNPAGPAGAPPPHGPHPPQDARGVACGGSTAANVYHHGAAEPPSYTPAPQAHGQGYGHGYGYGLYAPSPLTRWDMLGTPRQHEYFSGEYRWYYPTPVREKIYSIATDANRLTSIFSEENPNACTIV
uniref:Uncharacterized protein n=1 Tax=Arundo donax TaxID=35708 RepID=A0A0A9GHF3_ARUDO